MFSIMPFHRKKFTYWRTKRPKNSLIRRKLQHAQVKAYQGALVAYATRWIVPSVAAGSTKCPCTRHTCRSIVAKSPTNAAYPAARRPMQEPTCWPNTYTTYIRTRPARHLPVWNPSAIRSTVHFAVSIITSDVITAMRTDLTQPSTTFATSVGRVLEGGHISHATSWCIRAKTIVTSSAMAAGNVSIPSKI